jgi:hypothetical protein
MVDVLFEHTTMYAVLQTSLSCASPAGTVVA